MAITAVKRIKVRLIKQLKEISPDINDSIEKLLQKCNKSVTQQDYLTRLEIESLVEKKIDDVQRSRY